VNWEDEEPKPQDQFGASEPNARSFNEWAEWMHAKSAAYRRKGTQYPQAPAPADHRTPSPAQSYESLDHFLFQPEIHWNGQTVGHD
jgi:hypothetical protein